MALFQSHEICEQSSAVFGKEAFRMELHAMDLELLVPDRHDFTLPVGTGCVGCDYELRRQAGGENHQTMVARGDHRIWNSGEDSQAIMIDLIGFAVH